MACLYPARMIWKMGLFLWVRKKGQDAYANQWNLNPFTDDDELSLDPSRQIDSSTPEPTDLQYPLLSGNLTVDSFTESLPGSSQPSSFSIMPRRSIPRHPNNIIVEAPASACQMQYLAQAGREPLEPSANASRLETVMHELTQDLRFLQRSLIQFPWPFELNWSVIGCCCEGAITHTHGHPRIAIDASLLSDCVDIISDRSGPYKSRPNISIVRNDDTTTDLTRPRRKRYRASTRGTPKAWLTV